MLWTYHFSYINVIQTLTITLKIENIRLHIFAKRLSLALKKKKNPLSKCNLHAK